MLFLIDYDRKSGQIVQFKKYDATMHAQASEERLQLELELNRKGIEREVVLLEAATEADLRRTHRNYFATLAELAQLPEAGDDRK